MFGLPVSDNGSGETAISATSLKKKEEKNNWNFFYF